MGKQGVAEIGLFKIRGHLSKEFIRGYADIHRKLKLPPDPFPNLICYLQRRAEEVDGRGHIEKGLVDAEFFNVRTVIRQKLHHLPGFLKIYFKTGRNNGKGWALSQCLADWLAGYDSISFRRGGFCQNDSMP